MDKFKAWFTHDRLTAIAATAYAIGGYFSGHLTAAEAVGIVVAAWGGCKLWATPAPVAMPLKRKKR
jgi:hypothetical protein